MTSLTSFAPEQIASGTFMLPAYCPIPGMGVLPMNAFVIRGRNPILIDAGPAPLQEEFMNRLVTVIDPPDLRYIWLTHTDPDHIGAIERLLAAAPEAKVVTTFLGAGKMGLHRPIPQERLHLLEPGGRLDLGDRELAALRPPTYDAPETIAAFDCVNRTLFSADSFGALTQAPAGSAAEIEPGMLREGMVSWAGVDAPWLAQVDAGKFDAVLEQFRRLCPKLILSGHLPPAHGMAEELLQHLRLAAGAAPPPGLAADPLEALTAAGAPVPH